jgi:hypothetical protein
MRTMREFIVSATNICLDGAGVEEAVGEGVGVGESVGVGVSLVAVGDELAVGVGDSVGVDVPPDGIGDELGVGVKVAVGDRDGDGEVSGRLQDEKTVSIPMTAKKMHAPDIFILLPPGENP